MANAMYYEDQDDEHPNQRPSNHCTVLRAKVMKSTKSRVIVVVFLGLLVGLAVPTILTKFVWKLKNNIRQECQLPPELRLDALTRFGDIANWTEYTVNNTCSKENSCDSSDKPLCYHPHPANYYYKVTEIKPCNMEEKTDFSVYAKMVEPKGASRSKQVSALRMRVDEMEDHRVVVRVFNDRATLDFTPYDYLEYKGRKQNDTRCDRPNRLYDLSQKPSVAGRLFVNVKRNAEKAISIFNTNFGALIAEDQYLEITTVLPSNNIYGLGQGKHHSLRHNQTHNNSWLLFAGNDEGWGHGVHPFYLCLEEDGQAHGVLLEHTNAVQVTLQAARSITYRSIGSNFAFHILMGPTPADVIKQLTDLVGRPKMPPYWALGHHICREDASHANSTVYELREKKVPHESDCFSDTLSLRSTTSNWADVSEFAESLSTFNQKLLLVHVPQVLENEAEGNSDYVWQGGNKNYVLGRLRQKDVLYPNYFQGLNAWVDERLRNISGAANLTFDGYLLHNNTPVDERQPDRVCPNNFLNAPQFLRHISLTNKTLCLDTCHGGKAVTSCKKLGDKNHYNLHNIYGFMHTKTVSHVLKQLPQHENKKMFLTSLSTFTGSGQYGGHFPTGFNSTWEDMKVALIQSLEFNLFGIPLVGAPVCGYHFKKDRELCSRWTQLSAFQPLLISYHQNNDEISTPVLMDDSVTSIAAAAFKLRYSLLPYLNTLFYYTSLNGSPVMRPLFFEFPSDPATWGIDEQFLWGPALMVSPVLRSLTQLLPVYFPAGVWYDFYTGDVLHQGDKGAHKNISAIEQHHINLHVRGGHILVTQKQHVYTSDVRSSNHTIRVPLNKISYDPTDEEPPSAIGQLYIDDGISTQGPRLLVTMEVVNGNNLTFVPKLISGTVDDFKDYPDSLYVESVYIFGLRSVVTDFHCQVNNIEVQCFAEEEHSTLLFRNLGDKLDLSQENYLFWVQK